MKNKLTPFEHNFCKIAVLFGEKSRALMLWHLSDGRPHTASELAFCVDISAQATSNHLSQLIEMNIIEVEKSGRYKYYRIINPQVAMVLENMANLLPGSYDRVSARKLENNGTKFARTCYDHLAGKLGVDITSALIQKRILARSSDSFVITKLGTKWFLENGIELDAIQNKKRILIHKCLDWTEKKHHMSGAVGSAFLEMMLKNDWIRRKQQSRELLITSKGKSELKRQIGINF